MNIDLLKKIIWLNLGLAFLEGIIVIGQSIRAPSEAAAALFLGFSLLRLLLLVTVLFVLAGIAFLLIASLRSAWWQGIAGKFLTRLMDGNAAFWGALFLFALCYFLIFASDFYLGPIAGYRGRLLPILVWFTVIAFQILTSWFYLRTLETHLFERHRAVLIPTAAALLLLSGLFAFIGVTRVGLQPDTVYWQEAGVPILFMQVLLVAGLGGVLYFLLTFWKVPDTKKTDTAIFLLLWVLTFVVWASTTPDLSYNELRPGPPNFQRYPFGDAMRYDLAAQNFLRGEPIPGDFLTKPLYSFFLSLFHLLAGQDFAQIVLIQVAFFAFIPSVAYLLTKRLGGRLAGLVAALLIGLREYNSIRLSNVIQIAHVKLLLGDVLAMGGMVLLCWLVLQWLLKPFGSRAYPVAAGGVLGLLILLRGHPVLLVPVLLVVALVSLWKKGPILRTGLLHASIGLALVMLPWFWHTYQLTGRFTFQDSRSSFQLDAFAQSFASSGTDSADYGEFQKRVTQYVLTHPADVVQFISAHYFHNTVFSYIFLPQSFRVESLREYVKRMPFWGSWDGAFGIEAWFFLLVHFSILAFGFGAAWKRTKGMMFVPLILCASYNLSVAVTRRSGWRFILPADWLTLIFYAMGIVQILFIVISLVKRSQDVVPEPPAEERDAALPVSERRHAALTGLVFFFIAISLTMGHKVFPVPESKNKDEILLQYIQAVQTVSEIDPVAVQQFVQQEGAVLVQGKALYPIYFKANGGALNDLWPNFAAQPYQRLTFYVIGSEPAGVTIRTESRPAHFPDGASVIVLGCMNDMGYIDALSVLLTSSDPAIVYDREPLPSWSCPLDGPG